MGYDGSLANLKGIYDVLVSNSPLNINSMEYDHYRVVAAFKTNVSTSVMDDLSPIPSVTTIPFPNGIQLKIASSSTSDALSGTGAQSIELHYLDTNYIEGSETIALSGTTAVNTTAQNIHRIQHFYVKQVGTNGIPVGNISLTNMAGSVTYDYISGTNQSLSSIITVPAGYIGFITGWEAASTKQAVSFRLRATASRYDRTYLQNVFIIQDLINLNNSSSGRVTFEVPLKCPPKTDIKISTIGSAASADASGSYSVLFIPDTTTI